MTSLIAASNTARTLISIAGAILLAWLFWTGFVIGLQTERADLIAAIWTHIGHGVLMTPLVGAYLWFRITAARRRQAHWTANAVFWLLIASIVFLLLSGPVVVWTYGFDLRVFDWFAIPNPVGKLPAIHEPLEAAHVIVAKALPIIFLADIALSASFIRQWANSKT